MIAVRVRRRSASGGYTVHWLNAASLTTRCGRAIEELDVVEELDLDKLPPVEACIACTRALKGWTRASKDTPAVTAEPRPPRVYKVGPLQHGIRSRRGRDMR